MCLSSVYIMDSNENELLAKNIATVKQDSSDLVFTDIMGITTRFTGSIEKIDLMENLIIVKKA